MSDNSLTPEALERLENAVQHLRTIEVTQFVTDVLALLRSYRTLERENRIAMRALTDDDWKRMAGSIIDTVILTGEDYVAEKLIEQLKRYFGLNKAAEVRKCT